jgi:hypothetical protein
LRILQIDIYIYIYIFYYINGEAQVSLLGNGVARDLIWAEKKKGKELPPGKVKFLRCLAVCSGLQVKETRINTRCGKNGLINIIYIQFTGKAHGAHYYFVGPLLVCISKHMWAQASGADRGLGRAKGG